MRFCKDDRKIDRIHTSAAQARAAGQAERVALYRRLLRVTSASLRQAAQVQLLLASLTTEAAERVRAELAHWQALVQHVCSQTRRRVLQGQAVPAADKRLSLFEPHTAVIRRGKVPLDAEFSRKLLLDEVDGGLVTRYFILAGNPGDAPEWPASLDHHRPRLGHPSCTAAADRAFFTAGLTLVPNRGQSRNRSP